MFGFCNLCIPATTDSYITLVILSVAEVLKYYGSRLNSFERSELQSGEYTEIWYLGLDATKIEGEEGTPHNHGYDDDNGSYIKVGTQEMSLQH